VPGNQNVFGAALPAIFVPRVGQFATPKVHPVPDNATLM
jgi:hypothetical protein